MTINPITLAEALALTMPTAVRDSIPAILAPAPDVWAAWGRDIVRRYVKLEAGPTVGDHRVRVAAEALAEEEEAEEAEDDERATALDRLREAGVDVSRPEWKDAPAGILSAHADAHQQRRA